MNRKAWRFSPTLQLILSVALFVATLLASREYVMTSWEIKSFKVIYSLPEIFLPFFIVVTQFGSIFMLALLALAYSIRKKYHKVLRLLLTGTLAYLLSGFAKDLWGRDRPFEFLLDVVNRDFIVRGPGFPSGHVALATALALTAGHYLPRKYHWLIASLVIAVALSRVYLGIHAPLDLIGGFAIGWFSYALFRHVRLQDVTVPTKRAKKS